MKIISYFEHENTNYFVGDDVILNKYGSPEFSCTIESIGDKSNPEIFVIPKDKDLSDLVYLKLNQIEKIRKTSNEEDYDETKVAVEPFGDMDGLRECFICRGCGCTEIFDSFTYCPNCSKEILWPRGY